jgi:hypothetical protein
MLLLSCQTNPKIKKEINNKTQETMVKENIYQFKVVDLSGNVFRSPKGKK